MSVTASVGVFNLSKNISKREKLCLYVHSVDTTLTVEYKLFWYIYLEGPALISILTDLVNKNVN